VERRDDRDDVALMEQVEEKEVNEDVGEANPELDRLDLKPGMEECFLIGLDVGVVGAEDENLFGGEPDPYGGVVRSKEVMTRVSCKLSSEEVLREPLEEEEEENGRE
jgi:hypothetical protein